MRRILILSSLSLIAITTSATANEPTSKASKPKLVIVAGKPSHPPRMHEFNAGVQLLARCLSNFPAIETRYVLNGQRTNPPSSWYV